MADIVIYCTAESRQLARALAAEVPFEVLIRDCEPPLFGMLRSATRIDRDFRKMAVEQGLEFHLHAATLLVALGSEPGDPSSHAFEMMTVFESAPEEDGTILFKRISPVFPPSSKGRVVGADPLSEKTRTVRVALNTLRRDLLDARMSDAARPFARRAEPPDDRHSREDRAVVDDTPRRKPTAAREYAAPATLPDPDVQYRYHRTEAPSPRATRPPARVIGFRWLPLLVVVALLALIVAALVWQRTGSDEQTSLMHPPASAARPALT